MTQADDAACLNGCEVRQGNFLFARDRSDLWVNSRDPRMCVCVCGREKGVINGSPCVHTSATLSAVNHSVDSRPPSLRASRYDAIYPSIW